MRAGVSTLIEQDLQTASCRNRKAPARMLEDCVDLLARYPGEPLQEVRDRRATLNILEERANGTAEDGASNASRSVASG